MHLELPQGRLDSFKDAVKHYLMIVLSILTALGLEAWIEHAHHQHAASTASAGITVELRDNLASIRAALATNHKGLLSLEQLDAEVTQAVRGHQTATDINNAIRAHKDQFILSIDWPHMPSQAWDVAVANQSAGWIGDAALRRYSNAYADQRSVDEWLTHNSTIFLDAPRMSTLRTRIKLGLDVDPVAFLGALDQMILTMQEAQSHLEQLEPQIAAALPAGPSRAALKAPATPSTS